MDKVREALEAAQTDLEITQHTFGGLTVAQHERVLSAVKQALTALQEAGEAKVRYAGWSPDKGNHYLIESSQPSPAAIRRERERCAKMADAWERPDALRLAAGEMTAQEMRTARAVAKGIAAAIRSLPDQPPAESSPGDAGESGGGHDLETPFYPCIIENHAGGVAEIILRDTTTIYTNELLTARVLRDAETREMIGLQWDIPMRAAAAAKQPPPVEGEVVEAARKFAESLPLDCLREEAAYGFGPKGVASAKRLYDALERALSRPSGQSETGEG